MLRRLLSLALLVSFLLLPQAGGSVTAATAPSRYNAPQIPAAWGDATVAVWNSNTNTPSFVSGNIPLGTAVRSASADLAVRAQNFLTAEGAVFGITDATVELAAVKRVDDPLGLHHVVFQQIYQGVPVYNAEFRVHMNAAGDTVVAMSSGFVPNLSLSTVKAAYRAEAAVARAQGLLPGGVLVEPAQLQVYAGAGSSISAVGARLSWVVTLYDAALPARNIYVVDAGNNQVIDLIETLHEIGMADRTPAVKRTDRVAIAPIYQTSSASLQTHDAKGRRTLPGALVREDDDPAVGDRDADNAHDFARAVFRYFFNTHNRDSFDGQGATIISTVHYGRNYMNAFWDGKQMVYGDGFAVRDVVAHELTHAVTTHTADLEYRWQSGALNESFSDIFGVMVDRDDWLVGEDLSSSALGGREAIRDMANPARFGQPAHTKDWVKTCSDQEGVHTNSGIFNKAYYNIATAIGKNKAERIFFRALTIYLQKTSSFADARAKVLRSTTELYPNETATYSAVEKGFNDVGLTANWRPAGNDCTCAATGAVTADAPVDLSEEAAAVSAFEVVATLYDVRDELLSTSRVGQHYRNLYYQHTAQINLSLLFHSDLRSQGATLLRAFTPGLQGLANGNGDEVVTADMVAGVDHYLADLKAQAQEDGYTDLAATIARERARLDLTQLVGMTFDEAWAYINANVALEEVFLPMVTK